MTNTFEKIVGQLKRSEKPGRRKAQKAGCDISVPVRFLSSCNNWSADTDNNTDSNESSIQFGGTEKNLYDGWKQLRQVLEHCWLQDVRPTQETRNWANWIPKTIDRHVVDVEYPQPITK